MNMFEGIYVANIEGQSFLQSISPISYGYDGKAIAWHIYGIQKQDTVEDVYWMGKATCSNGKAFQVETKTPLTWNDGRTSTIYEIYATPDSIIWPDGTKWSKLIFSEAQILALTKRPHFPMTFYIGTLLINFLVSMYHKSLNILKIPIKYAVSQ